MLWKLYFSTVLLFHPNIVLFFLPKNHRFLETLNKLTQTSTKNVMFVYYFAGSNVPPVNPNLCVSTFH